MSRPLLRAVVLLTAVLAVVGLGVPGTFAYFTDQATVAAGGPGAASTAFTSGGLATPATPTVGQNSGGLAAVSWTSTAVTTGAGSTTATSYDVVRYSASSGGTGTVVCSAVTGTSCTAPKTGGTSYYAVLARFQASWTKEGARRAHTPDTTGPTVVINDNFASCSSGIVCGTASDTGGGTVAGVDYHVLRTATRPGFATQYACWNGSAWTSSGSASCTWRDATGTTSWFVPGNDNVAYASPPNGWRYTYTIKVTATDTFGNVGAEDTASLTQ